MAGWEDAVEVVPRCGYIGLIGTPSWRSRRSTYEVTIVDVSRGDVLCHVR